MPPTSIPTCGRHERFTFHFVPTSCSRLNAVEGFFAKLSKRRLKRDVFRSVVDLQAAINRCITEANRDPRPFTWIADPDKITAAVRRGTKCYRFSSSARRRPVTKMWQWRADSTLWQPWAILINSSYWLAKER